MVRAAQSPALREVFLYLQAPRESQNADCPAPRQQKGRTPRTRTIAAQTGASQGQPQQQFTLCARFDPNQILKATPGQISGALLCSALKFSMNLTLISRSTRLIRPLCATIGSASGGAWATPAPLPAVFHSPRSPRLHLSTLQ